MYIQGINPLYDLQIWYMICKYFISCELFFHFFDGVLWSTEVCNFDAVLFIYFFFLTWDFGSYLRNYYLIQDHAALLLCVLLIVFIVSAKTVRPAIYLELMLIHVVYSRASVPFSCLWISRCPSAMGWKGLCAVSAIFLSVWNYFKIKIKTKRQFSAAFRLWHSEIWSPQWL